MAGLEAATVTSFTASDDFVVSNLDWATGVYTVSGGFSMYDGVIGFEGQQLLQAEADDRQRLRGLGWK